MVRGQDDEQMRRSQSKIRNVRDLAEALGMPKSTLFRWIDNPGLRQFSDEQIEILHSQLYWRQQDFDGKPLLHIKQTKDLLKRDLEADQAEGERGSFGSGFDAQFRELDSDFRRAIRKVINDEVESTVKRSLEESTARLNILAEQLRVKEQLLAEANDKLAKQTVDMKEMQGNLDFARMVADRFSYFAKQQEELKAQIDKLAS